MNNEPHLSCEIEGEVPFYDLDPAQIVWHGNYLNYFEYARQALFAQRGIDLNEFSRRTRYIFPISKTTTKHIYPLRHKDVYICKATLMEARTRIILDFQIRLRDKGIICAEGRTEQVAVKFPEMKLVLYVPEEIRTALGF
jgi:acyl-CoA thioester hydrolase